MPKKDEKNPMKFAPITHYCKKSNNYIEKNKRSNMHDGLGEDAVIKNTEYEKELVE